MILGVGIDLMETDRFERALKRHGGRLEGRIFTEVELAQCAGRIDRVQALAARFAAKEACLKALGTGWARGVTFVQVELLRAESGRPSIRLSGAAADHADRAGVAAIHVSLTHQPRASAAVVILEGGEAAHGRQ